MSLLSTAWRTPITRPAKSLEMVKVLINGLVVGVVVEGSVRVEKSWTGFGVCWVCCADIGAESIVAKCCAISLMIAVAAGAFGSKWM